MYTLLTSKHHQRVVFRALRNSESFCEAIGSIDSKLRKRLVSPITSVSHASDVQPTVSVCDVRG